MFLPFTISEPRFKIRKEKKGNEDGKREIRKLQEGIEAIGAEINSCKDASFLKRGPGMDFSYFRF